MNKTNKHKFKRNHKTRKHKHKNTNKKMYIHMLPNLTPKYIDDVSQIIFDNAPKIENLESYSPTVNKDLVMLQSINRSPLLDCNNENAFELKEPLQIGIKGKLFGKTCVPYYDSKAIAFLLKNLSANKHLVIDKIVPPIQSHSNCWFNTMFVTLFVSDKGRKFFHFFRQLMIEGIQANGDPIPHKLRDGFALLNYAIDASLTGNKYAYILDTNAIIRNIYDVIPDSYKRKLPYITDMDEAGNPIRYFMSLIYYLHNKSLQIGFIQNTTNKWKEKVIEYTSKQSHLPHIIVLEFYDNESSKTTNKPKSFYVNGSKYILDSCIIRDTTKQHFSATLTCNKKEYSYDGMSFHRLVPLEWKKYINSDYVWGFDESPLHWNFTNGYQMLMYYREK